MACKRPAPDGGDAFLAAASPCCKKPRPLFTSIFNYEYLHKLGAGSYGVVYKARDRRTGETVAVKWVRPRRGLDHGQPANLAAFASERDCLAACRGYPSVVQLRTSPPTLPTGTCSSSWSSSARIASATSSPAAPSPRARRAR
ncbi:uncharacterized protein [Oryza sativa Japonica Group]|uniref:uncharacterized protein n=1 Tax=Oryza sativa subsp. japonica TaxID=39947 RepID=UPI0007755C99|nr:uncharacterized protein LOC107279047 [Oryza sativa Japonica Group]